MLRWRSVVRGTKRDDEQGPVALAQIREPVNKFPAFVRFVVQQLKTLCPMMGKRKMAETLARAGLYMGTTMVANIRKEKPVAPPDVAEEADSANRVVASQYVPFSAGQRARPPSPVSPHPWHLCR